MRVKIGKYPSRFTCRIHTNYMNEKYSFLDWTAKQNWYENFLEKVEDTIQWVYDHTVNIIIDNLNQKVNVHIDHWDTWSMDHTLAPIILPMLKQLRDNKHGSPMVDDEDVPEELRSKFDPYSRTPDLFADTIEYDIAEKCHDALIHEKWDWVMNEMIYAFNCKANKDDVYMRIEDQDEMRKEQERISNGFRLFGKYYEGLWD